MLTRVKGTDLLIAPPNMPDSRFRNTVLFLTHHTERGSFALCVNRETSWTLPEVLEGTEIRPDILPNTPIYWGGPVSPNSLWMIHSPEWYIDRSSVEISKDWLMTSNIEMFQHIADGDYPQHFRIVMGHCSWGPGQLESELAGVGPWRPEHSWLIAQNMGPAWVLEQDPEELWASATTLCSHQAVDSWL